ncbi:hypothetical protein [Clostridium sp.]
METTYMIMFVPSTATVFLNDNEAKNWIENGAKAFNDKNLDQ